ncbi:carbon-nitrogen hydrolase family protein [Formosa sp. L2A11]|uniref:carbon-nitrogen hydrolase family protein n=1 Tax=Formosa sp. L2A11 TaxID=2686363 RepID=UPI00131B461F|nr:carbon-nitrogen hydrolase family protein [Formosa sp. L2A11]
MKICIAQTHPIKGDILNNIEIHKKLISLSLQNHADLIVFPELSLTGYEPELAKALAMTKDDSRLDDFQKISNENTIIIAVGLPIKHDAGICISMIIFQPQLPRKIYSKNHLHPGEEHYFVPGKNLAPITFKNNKIAFAICYEVSIPEHAKDVYHADATVYIASVLNSVNGVDKDINLISNTSKTYGLIAVMANYVGHSGGYNCAGKSSIWNTKGQLIEQLDQTHQGIAIVDTDTFKTIKTQLNNTTTNA